MEITYSGSSLLQILNADTDLSRSSLSYDIPGMSFSEYLMFYHRIKLPKYSPEDLLNNTADVNPRGNQENESNILNNVLMLEYN